MIWALLAILLFGGGGTTPMSNEAKRIEKMIPKVVQEKSRLAPIKASFGEFKKLKKVYVENNKQFAKELAPLIDQRLIDQDSINALIDQRHKAAAKEEVELMDTFLSIRAKFTKEEWARFYPQ